MKHCRRLPGKGKVYARIGRSGGAFNLRKFLKKTGRKLFSTGSQFLKSQAKQLAPHLLQELGPTALAGLSSKALEVASRRGAPDKLINFGSTLAQKGARRLADKKTKELSGSQQLVSNFISKQSADLLGRMMHRGSGVSRIGYGVSRVGDGVGRVGDGVSRIGSGGQFQSGNRGLFTQEATNLNSLRF